MPWNDNKGGGWPPGGGNRGPWGQGPSNGGGGGGGGGRGPNRPPDLDELWKRLLEYLKRWFPNQAPNAVMIGVVSVGMLFLWVLTGVYQIQPAEQGVVLRFGQYVDKLGSGLHVRLPYPIEVVLRPNVEAENQLNVGFIKEANQSDAPAIDITAESIMLTGDENVVDLDFDVFWKVADAEKYLFEVRDVESTIKAVAESAMREVVGNNKIETVQTEGRVVVQQDVQKLMQRILDGYNAGVTITRVILLKVDPPTQVIDAFRDVQAARADQEKRRNEAQKYQNTVVPQARGEVTKIVQDAEAYKQKLITEAQGEAQRFLSILEQYKNAKQVTRERMYLETMQRVLSSTNKIVIEGKNGMIQYLPMPMPELRRTQSPEVATPGVN
jgi:membrane protease subunit HflK